MGLLAVFVSCCSPLLNPVLNVFTLTERDGELQFDHQRHGMPPGVFLLAAEDLDDDGVDELLISDSGLSMVRGDGSQLRLWHGDRVLAAALVAATSQHGRRLLAVVEAPQGPTSLVQLSCSFAGEASCQEEGRVDIPSANALATGDVDEDGVMDVLVPGKDRIMLFLGRVRGDDVVEWTSQQAYGEARARVDETPRYWPRKIAVEDIDGDDHLDVVTLDDNEIRIFFGDGLGSWDESVAPAGQDHFDQLYTVSAGADSVLDVVGDGPGGPFIFENSGARSFEISRLPIPDHRGGIRAFVGSFQSDAGEVMVLDYDEGIAYLASPTQGTWEVQEIILPDDLRVVEEGIVADLDGDGRDEVTLISMHAREDGC